MGRNLHKLAWLYIFAGERDKLRSPAANVCLWRICCCDVDEMQIKCLDERCVRVYDWFSCSPSESRRGTVRKRVRWAYSLTINLVPRRKFDPFSKIRQMICSHSRRSQINRRRTGRRCAWCFPLYVFMFGNTWRTPSAAKKRLAIEYSVFQETIKRIIMTIIIVWGCGTYEHKLYCSTLSECARSRG